ncbi:hypothetical protein C8R43DRAFT_892745 [Mycena crocata]|nr:hypothetical protein C8R43DRAFT_892745 [Mycena crocata]
MKYSKGYLSHDEKFWTEHQPWLERQGYRLRPRYQPSWTPSWLVNNSAKKKKQKKYYLCEDAAFRITISPTMDAVYIPDGTPVMLKLVDRTLWPYEIDIARFFMSEPLVSDPANHCTAVREFLPLPVETDQVILVMPLLRKLDDPRFDTIGEIVAFFDQIFEGLQFMHKHRVAHRDCAGVNIMMDGKDLFSEPWHPTEPSTALDFSRKLKHRTRTDRPVKYYFIDFGISRKYTEEQCPPLVKRHVGADKSVPEFQEVDGRVPPFHNPFPTDVYYLGNMIRQHFLTAGGRIKGLDFVVPLIADMVHDEPTKRPTMDEVVERFENIRSGLSLGKLRSRALRDEDRPIIDFSHTLTYFGRRVRYVLSKVPAIPVAT